MTTIYECNYFLIEVDNKSFKRVLRFFCIIFCRSVIVLIECSLLRDILRIFTIFIIIKWFVVLVKRK